MFLLMLKEKQTLILGSGGHAQENLMLPCRSSFLAAKNNILVNYVEYNILIYQMKISIISRCNHQKNKIRENMQGMAPRVLCSLKLEDRNHA